METDVSMNGTLIWYYYICRREVWLISHGLNADQENENMDIGRFIHENSYARSKKEIDFGNIKIDVVDNKEGNIVIQEIKKSSRYEKSARMQLLYYNYELKKSGLEAKGALLFPEEKKRGYIASDEILENELYAAIKDIFKIINMEKPPCAEKCKYCKMCSYAELCWA